MTPTRARIYDRPVAVQWHPIAGSMTSVRIIEPYTWPHPGAVVRVAAAWWAEYELELLTAPFDCFTPVSTPTLPQE